MRTVSLIILLSLAIVPAAARAQSPAASASPAQAVPSSPVVAIHGRILDPTRAPIAGARVTAIPEGATTGPVATTDERGSFELPLRPGPYTLTVSAAGFADGHERISTNRTPPVEVVLQIAGVRDAVSVIAAGGYQTPVVSTATKTPTQLRDVPQSITIVTEELIKDQMMTSVGDVVRYVPGITAHQGENNRDQVIIRGNNSSADFFVDGVRDDVQYYRDLYNLERVEALKGANAMIFGRGGAGGVVNRVTKQAEFNPLYEATLQLGAFDNRRLTTDLDHPLNNTVALRLNAMYENSDSFRTNVGLERYGVSPTVTFALSGRTKLTFGYEFLHDTRVADRGIPSFHGTPLAIDPSTYFGNPADSHVRATVNVGSARVEHQAGRLTIRNQTLVGDYDRSYQNYVPGAVTADGTKDSLSAYNNATTRLNAFNQTDFIYRATAGSMKHTLLAGAEVGRQNTDNFRNTGFFNNTDTTLVVPISSSVIHVPVTFRQNATDANNHLVTNVAAAYAQDQVEVSRWVHVVGGVRVDRFDLTYHNNRNDDTLGRVDNLVSPRAGLIIKPIDPVSVYGSFSVSYLPSSGDQFSSLTTITQQVKPEQLNNYELGLKWDVVPPLALTTAVYRLDRTNTRSTDPNDPTRIVQTGSQRTNGYELGISGRVVPGWDIAGGYAYQHAQIMSATAASPAGAEVGQVPHHTLSLWNRYAFHPRVAAAIGVVSRSEMFAAIDNTVKLPGYARVDGAAFFSLTPKVRFQVNVENLFDKKYFLNADSNTNISPGFPRTVRMGLTIVR